MTGAKETTAKIRAIPPKIHTRPFMRPLAPLPLLFIVRPFYSHGGITGDVASWND
jgi:hypothetical protein